MEHLREIDGDNKPKERLIEVTQGGQKSTMTPEQVEALKERQDIRVVENGDKATVLTKLRG